MKKFYCNICDEEVELKNGKCPKCKTDWEKISSDSVNNETEPVDVYSKKSKVDEEFFKEDKKELLEDWFKEDDIDNNIIFLIKWGEIVKFIMIVLAIIVAIISFVEISKTEGYSLLKLIYSGLLIIFGVLMENIFKWMAYMLYTNKKNNKK